MRNRVVKKKVCLLGDAAVGKTSLIRQYVHGVFDDAYSATIGAVITKKALSDIFGFDLWLVIWDIMGRHSVDEIPKNYVEYASGAVIVADVTREGTIQNLTDWTDLFVCHAGERPYLYVINKRDLVEKAAVERARRSVESLATEAPLSILVTSAKTGENVERLFQILGRAMLESDLEREDIDTKTYHSQDPAW